MGCCGTATRIRSREVNGRKINSDLEFHGIVKNRQCRDVLCLLFLVIVLVFLMLLIIITAVKGYPARLLYGYDDYGNICGQKNLIIHDAPKSGKDMTNYKYLYLCPFENVAKCPNRQMRSCVEKCPDNLVSLWNQCALNKTAETFGKIFGISFFQNLAQDFRSTIYEYIIVFAISVALAILMLIILRCFVEMIVCLVLIFVSFAIIGGTLYSWSVYIIPTLRPNLFVTEADRNWLLLSIFGTLISVLFLLLVFVMRKRIELVSALFKEAGKAITAMPHLILLPFMTFLLLAGAVVAWLITYVYIHTSADPKVAVNGTVEFVQSDFYKGMKWFHFFAFLWIIQIIIASQHFVIACSVSIWFFTRDKRTLRGPLCRSISYLLKYHMGSIAFGAFIIALFKFVRAIIKFLEKRLNKWESCKFCLKCCGCCLWIFEKFLVFLNRNAYIEIAIHGYGFCKAAQEALTVLASNALRVVALNSVGAFLLFIAKVGITVATAFIAIEFFKKDPEMHYPWIGIVICCLFAYVVAHCFLSVYEMVIDTLFLCFCEDCKMNDGIQNPYFMSKGLMAFVEKSKKAGMMKSRKQAEIRPNIPRAVHPA